MAIWYCSNTQYALVATWTSATYAVGAIRRQTAPAAGNERCFRVSAITTGISGGTEPVWNVGKGTNTTDGGVTWTEVTGNSSFNSAGAWNAPHIRLLNALSINWYAAGDIIYVGQDHNYSYGAAGASFVAFNGTAAAHNTIQCVNVTTGATATGAAESTTGNTSISFAVYYWFDGVSFTAGNSTGTASIQLSNNGVSNFQTFRNGSFILGSSGASSLLQFGGTAAAAAQRVKLYNMLVKFSATTQSVNIIDSAVDWVLGGLDGSGSIPASFIKATGTRPVNFVGKGLDFTAMSGGQAIVGGPVSGDAPSNYQFVDCKTHSSTVLATRAVTPGSARCDFVGVGSAANSASQSRVWYEGTLTQETTNIVTGGASDGVTPISWKVVNTANARYQHPFECFRMTKWAGAGVAVPIVVSIMNDGTTLKDNDIWIEAEYLSSSSLPNASVTSSASSIIAAGSNLTTNSAAWVTSGIASPVKQQMSVSVTPQMAGPIYVTVFVARASLTVYIDPEC